MTQTFLDAAQVDELVAMYVAGKTMREVAEHFRVHRTTVAVHLRRRSVAVRRGKLTSEQVADIGDLYEQGFTLAEIGARFGVGQDTARRAVLDAGGVIRRPGRRVEAVMAAAPDVAVGGVDPSAGHGVDLDACFVERAEDAEQVRGAPAEAVDVPDDYGVDTTGVRVFQKAPRAVRSPASSANRTVARHPSVWARASHCSRWRRIDSWLGLGAVGVDRGGVHVRPQS